MITFLDIHERHIWSISAMHWTWWRHQTEAFSALLALWRGIHRSPVNSPHKGQWRRAMMFSLICAWINGWLNNREAGDFRRHRAHCDVTVMKPILSRLDGTVGCHNESQECHDANFVVTSGTIFCDYDGVTSYDIFGIMTILGFQWCMPQHIITNIIFPCTIFYSQKYRLIPQ